jgi:hypothetical protein
LRSVSERFINPIMGAAGRCVIDPAPTATQRLP